MYCGNTNCDYQARTWDHHCMCWQDKMNWCEEFYEYDTEPDNQRLNVDGAKDSATS